MTITSPAPAEKAERIVSEIEIEEKVAPAANGFLALIGGLALLAFAAFKVVPWAASYMGSDPYADHPSPLLGFLALPLALVFLSSLSVQPPGETKVVTFFGNYIGTIRRTGLTMSYPFTGKTTTPIRVLNFETESLKVNERGGSPVNVAAIIVWRVKDTARATFAVDNYSQFIRTQSEAALRHVVASHPYDAEARKAVEGEENASEAIDVTLRGDAEKVAEELVAEVNARVSVAGLDIIEARLSNLSYAPEIAAQMLQVQQSRAVLAARSVMVEGAAGLVRETVKLLAAQQTGADATNPIALSDADQSALARTLLPVLVSGHGVQPVLNTGS